MSQSFNTETLQQHLEQVFNQVLQPFELTAIPGGQSNPTFRLTAGEHRWILRKKPDGKLLPSAHQIDREYRVMQALQDTKVAVPTMRYYCEEDSVIGTQFYLMDEVQGEVIAQPELPGLASAQRDQIYQALVTQLAALHSLKPEHVGLGDFGKRENNFYARQLSRWQRQYESSCAVPAGGEEGAIAMRHLIRVLPQRIPQHSTVTLVHGDFRVGNMLLNPTCTDIAAVLDWELSTLGEPLSDLAYCCIPYHLSASGGAKGLQGLDLASLGIPAEAHFVAHYCKLTGRQSIDYWPFHVAFALFRLAAILQGVYARALQGNASGSDALQVGSRAALLATTAAELLS